MRSTIVKKHIPVLLLLFLGLVVLWSFPVEADMLTEFSVVAGSLLMAAGTIIFMGIWATRNRKNLVAVPAQVVIKH